jgi:hypothetical protein
MVTVTIEGKERTNMTVKETLKAARELIADRKHWTQDANARTKRNRIVAVNAPGAARWRAWGAILRARGTADTEAFSALSKEIGGMIVTFNDTHTHKQVLAAFDAAIENRTDTRRKS